MSVAVLAGVQGWNQRWLHRTLWWLIKKCARVYGILHIFWNFVWRGPSFLHLASFNSDFKEFQTNVFITHRRLNFFFFFNKGARMVYDFFFFFFKRCNETCFHLPVIVVFVRWSGRDELWEWLPVIFINRWLYTLFRCKFIFNAYGLTNTIIVSQHLDINSIVISRLDAWKITY